MDEVIKINRGGGTRNSNLELYRIIVMLLIVAHHYVVNSGILDVMYQHPLSANSILLFLFGMWGKIGINCFVLITGYFMCKSNITIKKFLKLVLEVEFYKIVIYMVFIASGYESFSLTGVAKAILPITSIGTNFTGCYLVFYLCIPFLNILVRNMSEKQHLALLGLVFFTYIFMGTLPKFDVTMNYVSWFICLYIIAAYIRLYPKKMFERTKLWGVCTVVLATLCILSVLCCVWIGARIDKQIAFYFVTDSNTFLAICIGVSSFLFFKNLKIKQSRVINTIAASTFGVLLIHANSDTMRKWLWQTVLNVKGVFSLSTPLLVLHAILSVLGVFTVCVIIDQIRIRTVEKSILDKAEKGVNRLLSR